MKTPYFLGKTVPTPRNTVKRRQRRFAWRGMTLLSVPFVAFLGFLVIQPQYGHSLQISQRAVGPAVSRTFATASKPPPVCKDVIHDAFFDKNNNIRTDNIFPFIPKDIQTDSYQKDPDGKIMTDASGNPVPATCGPASWTREVFIYFVFKVLVILNWLASVLAIIFTVYAGLLYIRGYAGEENVKKAKTLLLGTYVGLAIVFGARIMVYTAIDLFSSNKAEEAIKNSPVPIDLSKPLDGGSNTGGK